MNPVEKALMQSPRKFVKYLSQQLNLGASSTYWIIGDMNMFL
jgi:hypothetical protein